ncbi:MAG: tetratricopeptide repeat protein [Streptosporangiaceae bacterium]
MGTDRVDWQEADRLNEQGRASADAGDWDAALSLYRQAVGRVPMFEPAWFNLGSVYKRRRQWDQAMDCNERAAALSGAEGDPAWWNLGIAATALRRWDAARNAWRRFGIRVPDGTGELQMDLGLTPVRLNPDAGAEVVWGRRVDPARVVVTNVPTPESGHRWGDIVLHDGAPNGERRAEGRVYAVFDELERWQPSAIPTLQVQVVVVDETGAQALSDVFDQAGYAAQDWTSSIRLICKQCSEGRPSPDHEHTEPGFQTERSFGLAAPLDQATRLLSDWAAVRPLARRHSDPAAVG